MLFAPNIEENIKITMAFRSCRDSLRFKNKVMRKVYFSFMLLTSVLLNAQVVFESSLSEAFKKAKEQNKPVFIEYYNSDCSVCKRLGDLLQSDEEVSTFYNKRFINYAMNSNESLSEEDNITFNRVGEVENSVDPKEYETVIKPFVLQFNSQKARYVKVVATNFGKLPEWHQGFPSDGNAFIFIDEIEIK